MKIIQGNVTWHTISPPIESIRIRDISPEYSHIQTWGWVDCEALGKCVLDLFVRQGKIWPIDGVIRRDSVFDHYGRLDVDQDGKPIYTWANSRGVIIKGKPPHANEWLFPIKIPRRVSNGILSLVDQGIVRVSVERVPIPAPNHYFHIGHTIEGKKFEILSGGRGDGSYRVVEWRPPLQGLAQ